MLSTYLLKSLHTVRELASNWRSASATEKEALPVWMDIGYLQLYVPILLPLFVDKQSTEATGFRCVGVKVETPIHDSVRELVTWECKEHGVKS
jgi:hypothetical protein